MAAEAALRDSAHQAERELSKNIIELQAQEKKDRDSADSALAKRIEEFDGAMKVQVERTDGAVKRVDALEARARHAEESVKQDKEDRIAANTKETESRDAANRAIAVLATRIDEVEAKKHEVQSSAQKSDAEAAEKMAALQSNLAFLGKLLEESKSEMEAKLALEAKTSQDVTAVTNAKLKALHRDVSLEIHDNQQQLLDKLAVDKSKLDEKLDAGMSELETKLDALHSGQQKQEGNLQALETRLNQKLGTDTAATLQAMQRDMSIEIHDKHTELLKILATNKGELEEKMGAGQGELKDKQHAQERELKALETRLIFKIDGVAAAASADIGDRVGRIGERVQELGEKVEEHGTKIAEEDAGKASAGKLESDLHQVALMREQQMEQLEKKILAQAQDAKAALDKVLAEKLVEVESNLNFRLDQMKVEKLSKDVTELTMLCNVHTGEINKLNTKIIDQESKLDKLRQILDELLEGDDRTPTPGA